MLKSILIVPIILLFVSVRLFAQTDPELNSKFLSMLLKDDQAGWANLVHSLQRKQFNSIQSETLLMAEYGLIGFYMANEQYQRAQSEIEKFEKHLKQFKAKKNNPEHLAMDAAIDGYKIAIAPKKAVFLAGQNKHKLSEALKLNPNSALSNFEQANAHYFRPENFGGDRQKAIKLYEKAFLLLQNELEISWLYYTAGAWLGQLYTEMNELKKARNIYEILLADAPDFILVRDVLYPNIKQSEFDKKWDAFLEEAGDD